MSTDALFRLADADPESLRNVVMDLRRRIEAAERGFVVAHSASEIVQELGDLDYRVVDEEGRVRMVMSARNLSDEFEVDAHLAAFDTSGDVTFYVDADTGHLFTLKGSVGAWTIEGSTLQSLTDDVGIAMDASVPAFYIGDMNGLHGVIDGAEQAIYSSDYVAGQSGGRWDFATSTFEINNIIARGLIKTAVFQKDTISAVGGSLMVLPSVELAQDMLANNGAHLFLPEHILAIGEIVRMKGDGDDEWIEIEDFDFQPELGLWEYDVLRDRKDDYPNNENPQWKKGQAVVRYGPAGGGGVELTAGESPYIRVFDHDGSPWTSVSSIVQLDEGGIVLRNDSAIIAFRNSTETGYTGQIYGKSDDTFWVQGSHPGGAIRLSQLHASGTNSARLSVLEDPGNTGVSQITIDLGVNGTNWTIGGGEVVVWAGADGKETVFNDGSYDIDFRFEGTSGDVLKIDAGANAIAVKGVLNDTGLAHGTYTPTLTAVTNVQASSAFDLHYLRVGNTVHASGVAQVDPTATGLVELGISLPINSNLGGFTHLSGTGTRQSGSAIEIGQILGDAANDRAVLRFYAVSTAAQNWQIEFSYRVI